MKTETTYCDLCADRVPEDSVAAIGVLRAPADENDMTVKEAEVCASCRSAVRDFVDARVNKRAWQALGVERASKP